jgi:hypothetical protein
MSQKIIKRVKREAERLKREEAALRERIAAFRASDRLSREEIHDRDASRQTNQGSTHG